jgi:hypothetical protein
LEANHTNTRTRSPQSLPSKAPTGTYKNNPITAFKSHSPILDLTRAEITTLFNFLALYPDVPSFHISRSCSSPDVSTKAYTNAYEKLDNKYPETYQELTDSARFPLPPSSPRPPSSPHYHLCPSCGSSPLSANTTLHNQSYYTPCVMSDNSVNLSNESPMDDTTVWDDIPCNRPWVTPSCPAHVSFITGLIYYCTRLGLSSTASLIVSYPFHLHHSP